MAERPRFTVNTDRTSPPHLGEGRCITAPVTTSPKSPRGNPRLVAIRWIVEAARRLRQKQFVIDGEAVVLGVDGISDFTALYSRRHDHKVQFYAFDMLAGDGDDMRSLPLSLRKTNLARLQARRSDGIFIAPFEHGEIGPDLFRAACNMGTRRSGLEASGSTLPGWAFAALGEGQESGVPGNDAGERDGMVKIETRPGTDGRPLTASPFEKSVTVNEGVGELFRSLSVAAKRACLRGSHDRPGRECCSSGRYRTGAVGVSAPESVRPFRSLAGSKNSHPTDLWDGR